MFNWQFYFLTNYLENKVLHMCSCEAFPQSYAGKWTYSGFGLCIIFLRIKKNPFKLTSKLTGQENITLVLMIKTSF